MLSDKFLFIAPSSIRIPDDRQRSELEGLDTSDLEPSIAQRGIYNPLIVTSDLTLIAGRRRLATALKLGLALVPVRFDGELTSIERKIVELEENERRKDLPWRDQVRAIASLHELYATQAQGLGTDWSMHKTAEQLFYSDQHLANVLRVARDIDSPKIANAPGLRAAYNVLSRFDERRIGDAMASISHVGAALTTATSKPAPTTTPNSGQSAHKPLTPAQAPTFPESILNVDFIEWAATYSGPRFNLIHCDFPYGINCFAGEQSGRDKQLTYDDNPDTYWKLIRAFCAERERFMSDSAHMMFWLSFRLRHYLRHNPALQRACPRTPILPEAPGLAQIRQRWRAGRSEALREACLRRAASSPRATTGSS